MEWSVRRARLEDVEKIVKLSEAVSHFLMPYTLSWVTVNGYIDQFLVAEEVKLQPGVGGAVHFAPNDDTDAPTTDRAVAFLEYIKQVPFDVIDDFLSTQRRGKCSAAFIGQVICPGKGSFYAILEEAKKKYDQIWCWMSINGPSYKSYQRYGFSLAMDDVREFWNVYKCGYSKFVLGKWIKDGK